MFFKYFIFFQCKIIENFNWNCLFVFFIYWLISRLRLENVPAEMAKVATKDAKSKSNTNYINKFQQKHLLSIVSRRTTSEINDRKKQFSIRIKRESVQLDFSLIEERLLQSINLQLLVFNCCSDTIYFHNSKQPLNRWKEQAPTRKVRHLDISDKRFANVAPLAIVDCRINDEISTNMYDPPIYAYVSTNNITTISAISNTTPV